MAKWEAEKYAVYVGLLCDGEEVTMFKPLDINMAREIARKLNAFDEMLTTLRCVDGYISHGDDHDSNLAKAVRRIVAREVESAHG